MPLSDGTCANARVRSGMNDSGELLKTHIGACRPQATEGPLWDAAPRHLRAGHGVRAAQQHHEVPLHVAVAVRGLDTVRQLQVHIPPRPLASRPSADAEMWHKPIWTLQRLSVLHFE